VCARARWVCTHRTAAATASWPRSRSSRSLAGRPAYDRCLLECKTKTSKGWQATCGAVATHIEVVEIDGVPYAIAACDKHHNPSAVAIGDESDDALRSSTTTPA
jgi:hypothetical protein